MDVCGMLHGGDDPCLRCTMWGFYTEEDIQVCRLGLWLGWYDPRTVLPSFQPICLLENTPHPPRKDENRMSPATSQVTLGVLGVVGPCCEVFFLNGVSLASNAGILNLTRVPGLRHRGNWIFWPKGDGEDWTGTEDLNVKTMKPFYWCVVFPFSNWRVCNLVSPFCPFSWMINHNITPPL